MKKNKKFILVILGLILIIGICVIMNFKNKKKITEKRYNNKEVSYIAYTMQDGVEALNQMRYYDENGELVKIDEYKTTAKGDLSYNKQYDHLIYQFGPGGFIETNLETEKTKLISENNINIVRKFNNDLYYYNNKGYSKNGQTYGGEVCINNDNNCFTVNAHLADIFVIEDKIYLLSTENLIYIYKNKKEINKENELKTINYSNNIFENKSYGVSLEANNNTDYIYDHTKIYTVRFDEKDNLVFNGIDNKFSSSDSNYNYKKGEFILHRRIHEKNIIEYYGLNSKEIKKINIELDKSNILFKFYVIK